MSARLVPDLCPQACVVLRESLVIGRQSEGFVEFLADDAQVSRRHAELLIDGSSFIISDLGSQNGTYVNGVKIGEPFTLSDGDRIRIGTTSFLFRGDGVEDSLGTTILAAQGIKSARRALGLGLSEGESRRHDRLKTLYRISEKIAQIRDLDALPDDILAAIFDIMPVDRAAILLRNQEGHYLIRASRFRSGGPVKSTGLGLSIAREILNDHEGSLQLDTNHSPGARFVIDIPCGCPPQYAE